jgi:UTP:GlnB (protein PII) uridylyltransferase
MLTLMTFADIKAVNPDALTPWKAENLWRLAMSTANQLDRNVDEERVHSGMTARVRLDARKIGSREDEKIARMFSLHAKSRAAVEAFLEGFPERYVSTRSAETMLQHFEMTRRFEEEPFQIAFKHGSSVSEITLVTQDRPRLFAGMAAALAAWGMNVVTADAFANAAGVVVDSFRFTDTFKTLELNESERDRFVAKVAQGERGDEGGVRWCGVFAQHTAAGDCAGCSGVAAGDQCDAERGGMQCGGGTGGYRGRDGYRRVLPDQQGGQAECRTGTKPGGGFIQGH